MPPTNNDAAATSKSSSRFSVNFDVTVRDGNEDKVVAPSKSSLLYDKYSRSKLKKGLFHPKKEAAAKKEPELDSKTSSLAAFFGVPLGANTDVFRSYAGDTLSQADFERKILGVSTATEVSVKSRICVKGRCYDADENGQLISK